MSYINNRENSPAGLYMFSGWTETCVFPDVTRQQAADIIQALDDHGPGIGANTKAKSSDIIVLGLSC